MSGLCSAHQHHDSNCPQCTAIQNDEKIIRPSFLEIYMSLAENIARRSTCKRLAVGTVITSTDFRKVLAVGYNGNASGLPNQCDSDEPSRCGCVHAETNSIVDCDAPRYIGKIVFCTHLPCVACAKLLINLGGVECIFYKNDYRIKDSLNILKDKIAVCEY